MTHRCLRFALCALLLSAPLATLAADGHGMFSAGSFYASLNYDVAFPAARGLAYGTNDSITADIETGWGFLGAQIGVGYAISGFRPEVYGAFRRAPISGLNVTKLGTLETEAALAPANKSLDDVKWGNSAISSLDLGIGVHYDIDTGTPLLPYLGIAGGASNITVTLDNDAITGLRTAGITLPVEKTESAWALGFQGNAGIGYAVTEDLIVTLGYRLTGATEAELATSKMKLKLALIHNGELGFRYVF